MSSPNLQSSGAACHTTTLTSSRSDLENFIRDSGLNDWSNKTPPQGISGIPNLTLTALILAHINHSPCHKKRGILCLLNSEEKAEQLKNLTCFWLDQLNFNLPCLLFPKQRNQVISTLFLGSGSAVTFASLKEALASDLATLKQLSAQSIIIDCQSRLNLTELKNQLAKQGYQRNKLTGQMGEFSIRGEILDIFPYGYSNPARLVLAGNKVESINQFDFQTKNNLGQLAQVVITPQQIPAGPAALHDYLADNTLLVPQDPEELASRLTKKEYLAFKRLTEKFRSFSFYFFPTENKNVIPADIRSVPMFLGKEEKFISWLREQKDNKVKTIILTRQPKTISRHLARIKNYPSFIKIIKCPAMASGFFWPDKKLAVISDQEIFAHYQVTKPRVAQEADQEFLSSIKEGDFVVHFDHGIGRFVGMKENILEGVKKEYFYLEYAEQDKLFVPVETAEKLSKYIGLGHPISHRLHGAAWHSIRQRVGKDTLEFAKRLLARQAQRETIKGETFASPSQEEQQLAQSFIYQETPDQERTIGEVRRDLQKEKPMDRLIVGDVGFGKTEIAVRAAFAAVGNEKQVALLAPTTVLAQQHYDTFRERLKDFPCAIALLSRFQTKSEQKKIIAKIKKGTADIVIGTHRLLQKDINFANLGLVIIDEEQRFGVDQKEIFKKLNPRVHLLTLTATPIPRTLHLSLAGLRNISVIRTPPPGRLPITTVIQPYTEELTKKAIMEEVARRGQVYFLHNDIETIRLTTQALRKLAPKARIDYAHGRLIEKKLIDIFKNFDTKRIDVLVSTTIIENGLDLPNVNTLIVEDATQFGLAQLYQLRGRIGRGPRQAYAYFFYQSQKLSLDAKKRLRALLEAKELGTGYELARRDMEIRGIGNIVGPQQHGNACAIGLHLYTSLLQQAIAEIKTGQTPPPIREVPINLPLEVAIPNSFEPDQSKRIKLYQRLSGIRKISDLRNEAKRLTQQKDLPEPMKNLFELLEIRILAQKNNIASIDTFNQNEDGVLKKVVIFKYIKPLSSELLDQLYKISDSWIIGNWQAKISLEQLGHDWLTKIKKVVNIFQ